MIMSPGISKPAPAVWSVLLLASVAAGLLWRIYRVRKVRHARINECQSKYAYLVDKPEKMTCESVEAFQLCCALLKTLITRQHRERNTEGIAFLGELLYVHAKPAASIESLVQDFPWSLITSDSLALFKTYAIPTISSVRLASCRPK